MKLNQKLMLLTSMLVVGAISTPMTFAEDNTKEENPTVQVGTVENNDGNVADDAQSGVVTPEKPVTPENGGEVVDPTPEPEKPVTPTNKTGWDGDSYYINGEKVTSKWIYDKDYDNWFYIDENGHYKHDTWEGGYWLNANGEVAKNQWIYDKDYDNWFKVDDNGHYKHDIWEGGYWLNANGEVAKNQWIYDKAYENWFKVDENGHYKHDAWEGGYWLNTNGEVAKNQWIYDKAYENWFKVDENGHYKHDTWEGGYYLNGNGEVAKSQWIHDKAYENWFKVDDNGHYLHDIWVGEYYLESNGEMAHNEWIWDKDYNNWFFIKEDGKYAHDEWVGTYYVGANGAYDKNYMGTDWSVVNGTWKSRSGKEYKNVGSDLVVISIDQQKLWIMRNGDIVTNLNVVTGLQHVHDTPKGKFSIQSKQSPTVLVGPGYASPVSYWIPFIGNLYGIHDASWQPSYVFNSASSFKTMGSKGCVNVKPSQMAQVYSKTYVGMPVIIY